jgi:hypothetical protein
MLILQIVLSLSLLSERQAVIMARPAARSEHKLVTERARGGVFQTTKVSAATERSCTMAAETVRDWGWGNDESGVRLTPISNVVAAVNYQLRINSGQLGSEDLARLKLARLSSDPCFRELATSVLATQTGEKTPTQSVTRSSEKQSLTREALSP